MNRTELGNLPLAMRPVFAIAGDHTQEAQDAVIKAHGGVENLMAVAAIWATQHDVMGLDEDIFVAYATAVELGYRLGRKGASHES